MGKNVSKNKRVDLFDAASHGDINEVKFFVEKKHISVDTLNTHHQSAAHTAVFHGHLNVLRYLVSKNPFLVPAQDDKGETIFHIASKRGFLDIVEFLAHEFKSDLFKKTARGRTPLQLAAENHHLHIVEYLIDVQGADVLEKASDATGDTAVHSAAKCGHLNVLGYLLEEKEVSVDVLNGMGQSPLFSATIGNHSNIVRYLVEEHNANVTITDKGRNTVLHYAFANENLMVARYLLDEKKIPIDVNASNDQGETLVSLAIEQRNLKLLKYVVHDKNAHLNVPDRHGDYPLHTASRTDDLELVQCLVAHGASPSVKNLYGKTPFDIAKLRNKHFHHGLHTRFLEYLELITPRRRRRRNLSLRRTIYRPALAAASPRRIFADLNNSIRSSSRGNGEGIHESPTQFKQLNNFLALLDECIRYATESHYQLAKNDTLLTPTEIVQRQIDPLAISILCRPNSKWTPS